MSTPALAEVGRCFLGVIPSIVATSDAEGVPNVTYVSQVHLVDERHVALSRQFFNKTARNLEVNPRACAEIYDPLTFEAYRLRLRFLRSETSGPLFDDMALRIQAIASHTGMAGIFKLIGADLFEVERFEQVQGFLSEPAAPLREAGVQVQGLRTELRGLQCVSERINRAEDLETLLESVLEALEALFGFAHTMVLLADECTSRLVATASRGYGPEGIGAEVAIGEGLLGTVARERRLLRVAGLHQDLSYGRAARRETLSGRSASRVLPEIPLPGLADARSAVVIPLVVCERLVGVLAAESPDPLAFDEWHAAYLEVIANQIALGLARMLDRPPADEPGAPSAAAPPAAAAAARAHTFCYYRHDDCVFVDGEYLIRNVPARILRSVLVQWARDGRTQFTNRELRLDRSLGLPELRDNLESRLILLRRRLEQKCPDVRLVPTGRGRFELQLQGPLELVEKDSA